MRYLNLSFPDAIKYNRNVVYDVLYGRDTVTVRYSIICSILRYEHGEIDVIEFYSNDDRAFVVFEG